MIESSRVVRELQLGWASPAPDSMSADELCRLLDALAEAGYEGIEAMIAAPYDLEASVLQQMLSERHLRLIGVRTGGIVEQRGLSLSARDPDVRRRAVTALSQVIEYSAQFGQPKVLLGLMQGRLEQGVSLSDAQAWIADGLVQCAAVAARNGMEIDLEPINRFLLGYNRTVADILVLIRHIGAPNVRLLVDSFHMQIEEQSVAAALTLGAAQIGHVHLADSNRRAPGAGHLDLGEFLRTLWALGYHGVLTVECDYWPDQISAARAAASFLRGLAGSAGLGAT